MSLTQQRPVKADLVLRNDLELRRLATFRGSWEAPVPEQTREESDPFKLVERDLANTYAFATENIVRRLNLTLDS